MKNLQKSLHILVIPSWYPTYKGDANGVFFREQALALEKYGHQVGVIYPQLHSLRTWRSAYPCRCELERELDVGLTTIRSHGISWIPRIEFCRDCLWLWHGIRLYRRYKKKFGRPEIIHAHSMLNGGLLARHIQRREGIPFVVTEHYTGYARKLIRPRQLRIARSIARSAARRFAVSQPFCDLLSAELGVGSGPWIEMPNIVAQHFASCPLPQMDRVGGIFRFICVALLSEKKGVHNLIRAFAKSFRENARVCLDIGGDGEERSRLEALVCELNLGKRVKFLGALSREQVAEAIGSANAFVLASSYETFGVVVIEALALGKPVIATRCGGPEAIVRVNDGLLVPPNDVDALSEAMSSLYANYDWYQAPEIRATCLARFSEQTVAKRLTEAYIEVIEGRPA